MKILDKLIGKQIILGFMAVVFALLSVDLFFYFVNELRFVGHGDYTLLSALAFIALTIPRKIYVIFPWAGLLGALLALGSLAKSSELIAMRSAAFSIRKIVLAVLKVGAIITLVMFIFGEVLAPKSENLAQQKKTTALSRGQAIQTEFGTWIRHGADFIHIGQVNTPNSLQDVTKYNFDEKLELNSAYHAESAEKQEDGWNLENIQGTQFINEATNVIKKSEEKIDELLDSEILEASSVKHLERLTLTNLWHVIKMRSKQELNSTEYQHAFWSKVMQPLAGLVMIFLAIPFAFGSLRSASLGFKFLIGIILGFSFHTVNLIFGPLTEIIKMPPVLAAMIPTTIFLCLGVYLLSRVK